VFGYGDVMVTMNTIKAFGRRLGSVFGPQRVILFGSYAEGNAGEDSDVDLIVRTPEKIQDRLDMGDGFIRQILDEGKVLYESDVH
jgi:predicted nucleotidyltransferase